MRRAIVIVPSAFTAGNLFFGIWSIVEAARGNLSQAAWFIVVAGVLDLLDGRIARMSRTGSAFGAELDSLVDVVSFGVAPGLLLYYLAFKTGEWAWLLSFAYVLAAALRLARFNVEQAGHAKTHFFGLPSPGAGVTLATYYPFSQTPFVREHLQFWPWPLTLVVLVIMASLLMVSHVPYPVVPKVDFKTWRGRGVIGGHLFVLAAVLYFPAYFFFPAGVLYLSFGLLRAAFLGFLVRLPERDPLRDEDEDAERPIDYGADPTPLSLPFGRHTRGGGPNRPEAR